MIKGPIQEEDITLINIYVCNVGAPKYIKQLLLDIKGEIEVNEVTVGEFTTPLTSTGRSSRQEINKVTEILTETIKLLDLIVLSGYYVQKNQNTHSFQVHMEYSPEKTTYYDTEQALANLRG